jgi:acyl carrier protein
MLKDDEQLAHCFRLVFPGIKEEQIATASPATLPAWDSAASITLLMLIEEEFKTSIDFESMAELDSFSKIASHLKTVARG